MSFREACWNLGASRWQTIRTLVLPNSISGILTGVILQVSRAAGETAPILFTGAVFFMPTDGCPAGLGDSLHGAVHAPLHADDRRSSASPKASSTAPPWCSSDWCWRSTACRSACAVYLRSRKKW